MIYAAILDGKANFAETRFTALPPYDYPLAACPQLNYRVKQKMNCKYLSDPYINTVFRGIHNGQS